MGGGFVDRVLMIVAGITFLGYLLLGIYRPSLAAHGLNQTSTMMMQSAPWIIVSMFAAGLLAQFLDPSLVARWLGKESGFVGILIGASLGLVGTGSRWAVYPLAAGLLTADSSPGAVFSFITSWQLVSLPRVPAEVPFLGLKFTIMRAGVSFLIAIIGGVLIEVGTRFYH